MSTSGSPWVAAISSEEQAKLQGIHADWHVGSGTAQALSHSDPATPLDMGGDGGCRGAHTACLHCTQHTTWALGWTPLPVEKPIDTATGTRDS